MYRKKIGREPCNNIAQFHCNIFLWAVVVDSDKLFLKDIILILWLLDESISMVCI